MDLGRVEGIIEHLDTAHLAHEVALVIQLAGTKPRPDDGGDKIKHEHVTRLELVDLKQILCKKKLFVWTC